MANPYTSIYMPSGFLNDQTGLSPVFQNIGAQQAFENQQIAAQNQLGQQASQAFQDNGSMNPLMMAAMLRQNGGGNVNLPTTDTAQMNGVAGMGNSMGTGLTQDSYNSGIGFNPSAQSGGYGIKY